MRSWAGIAACVWALVGCGAETEQPASSSITVDAEIRDDVEAAVDLWARATDGAYMPELVNEGGHFAIRLVDSIPDCGEATNAAGCQDAGVIRISRAVPADVRISTIAHEIGHTLRLQHRDDGSLLDQHRTHEARQRPCVEASLTDAAGIPGPGACLFEAPDVAD